MGTHSWVRLNKRTKTAIDRDDRKIVRFLCGFSSKKGIDIETIFLAEYTGFGGFHWIETLRASLIVVRSTGYIQWLPLSASARDGSISPGPNEGSKST
jgi:hypothetical protein